MTSEFERRLDELKKLHYGHRSFLGQRDASTALLEVKEIVKEARQEFPQVCENYCRFWLYGRCHYALEEGLCPLMWFKKHFGSAEGGE